MLEAWGLGMRKGREERGRTGKTGRGVNRMERACKNGSLLSVRLFCWLLDSFGRGRRNK